MWVKFVPRQNFVPSVITTLLIDKTNFGWIYMIQHWYYKNPLLFKDMNSVCTSRSALTGRRAACLRGSKRTAALYPLSVLVPGYGIPQQ